MPRCSAPWKTMFFSSMDALTIGNAFSASTAAFETAARYQAGAFAATESSFTWLQLADRGEADLLDGGGELRCGL